MASSVASKKGDDESAPAPSVAKADDAKVKETAPSFSYFTLYRYATWGEILLNFLALFAAIVVGTAQVSPNPRSSYMHSSTDLPAPTLPRLQSSREEFCELWHCRFALL